jgi:hypothetical protein
VLIAHCLSLIKHREFNDHPIEVVAQYFTSLQRHCKSSALNGPVQKNNAMQKEQPHAKERPHAKQSPMHRSKRCGAKRRTGGICQSPAMPNGRCRLHGGWSQGPPFGNKNALKHGRYTAEAIAKRRRDMAKKRRERALQASGSRRPNTCWQFA